MPRRQLPPGCRNGKGRAAWVWTTAALGIASLGCVPQAEPELGDDGTCPTVIWGEPRRAGEPLAVLGSWDDWSTPIPMHDYAGSEQTGADVASHAWQLAELSLPPGVHGYLVLEEGRGHVADHNALTGFRERDGLEISRLEVPDCRQPWLAIEAVHEDESDGSSIDAHMTLALDEAPLDPQSCLLYTSRCV